MEWTFEEFFDAGGTTAFVDRLAASIGIHASTIKVVSVYQGTVNVEYFIHSPSDSALELERVRVAQIHAYATNQVNLGPGADILDVSVYGVKKTDAATKPIEPIQIITGGVVTAPGYVPIVITQTAQNTPGYEKPGSTKTPTTPGTTPGTTTDTGTGTQQQESSTDQIGQSQVGIVDQQETAFTPHVKIVTGDKQQGQGGFLNKGSIDDIIDDGGNSGKFIIIAAIVFFFILGALISTRIMLNHSRQRMILEAVTR